ncbi:hypothetical protein HQ587_08480 [bacterium]|nr:hypothetical protein [bacterium]
MNKIQFTRRDRLIFVLVGLLAILTAIFGYSGLYDKLTRDPYLDLTHECYYIIDQAQLWYSRPPAYEGGGKSFTGLDFHQLGLSDIPGTTDWCGEFGSYSLKNIHPQSFDLLATATDSTKFSVEHLRFDTRPQLKMLNFE